MNLEALETASNIFDVGIEDTAPHLVVPVPRFLNFNAFEGGSVFGYRLSYGVNLHRDAAVLDWIYVGGRVRNIFSGGWMDNAVLADRDNFIWANRLHWLLSCPDDVRRYVLESLDNFVEGVKDPIQDIKALDKALGPLFL